RRALCEIPSAQANKFCGSLGRGRSSCHRHPNIEELQKNGPRAVLGSQQPSAGKDAQIDSTSLVRSDALRAEDGSRSGGGVKSRPWQGGLVAPERREGGRSR